MKLISNKRIGFPNVERKAYIFFNPYEDPSVNKCIGEFIEQENDAGEVQYLFRFYQDRITDWDLDHIAFPGIDMDLRKNEYVRSGGLPYYVECSTIQDGRGDLKRWLDRVHLDFNDKFEYMVRTRAITQKTNCYLGRNPEDKINLVEWKKWGEYQKSHFPNMPIDDSNEFHRITEV